MPSLRSSDRDCSLNFFGVDASQPLSVWTKKGWIHDGRSARLVPVVLPLLHGPPHAGRRPPPDQALEGDPPSCPPGAEELRAGRPVLPPPATPGAAALGLRQPQNLKPASARNRIHPRRARDQRPAFSHRYRNSAHRRRIDRGVVGKNPVARQRRRRRILAVVLELLARLQHHARGARPAFGLVSGKPAQPDRRDAAPDGAPARSRPRARWRRPAPSVGIIGWAASPSSVIAPLSPARQRIAVADTPFVAIGDLAEHFQQRRMPAAITGQQARRHCSPPPRIHRPIRR